MGVGLGLKGPYVFKFVLLSFYLWQMENGPEVAGGPQEGAEGQPQPSSAPLSPPIYWQTRERAQPESTAPR